MDSTCEGGGIEARADSSGVASFSCGGSGEAFLAFPPMRKPLGLALALLTGGGDVAGSAGGSGEGDLALGRACLWL